MFEISAEIKSVVVPDLVYCPFKRTVLYEGSDVLSPPLVFQFLLCMEFCKGVEKCEIIKDYCWIRYPSVSSFKLVIYKTSCFFLENRIPAEVYQKRGWVHFKK